MLPTSDAAMEASLEESAIASVPDQLRASFLDHLQDIHEAAGLASVHSQDKVVYVSEDTDSEDTAAHRSKLRKRWNQQATEAPVTPPTPQFSRGIKWLYTLGSGQSRGYRGWCAAYFFRVGEYL